mgnify:CR=1 FL=1
MEVNDEWLDFPFGLMGKIVNQRPLALDSPVGQVDDLGRVEAAQRFPVELMEEVEDIMRLCEVDEGVSHVAVVLWVDWQVEEVISAQMVLVDLGEQHVLRELVRYVFNHDSCPLIYAIKYGVRIDREGELAHAETFLVFARAALAFTLLAGFISAFDGLCWGKILH